MNSSDVYERIDRARHEDVLALSRKGLVECPPEIFELRHLKRLHLAKNRIDQISPAIGQLKELEALSLAGNPISPLPSELWHLTNLKYLWLDETNLEQIPSVIDNLQNLELLGLWGNKLQTIPREIGLLKHLRELYLGKNRISFLPDTIGQLTRLQCLDARDNRLTALPGALLGLPALVELYLHGNADLGLPIEVLGPTLLQVRSPDRVKPARPKDILDYYLRIRGSQRSLNEAKLILVGYGAVGKTSLVNQLIDGSFNESEKKTEGINIRDWPVSLEQNNHIRLHVWDFGGQEILHSTHQFFLTERSLYLLVLAARDRHPAADVEHWLTLIQSFAPDSPVIVVLNKIHEQAFTLNRDEIKQHFPKVRTFVETDCKDRTGIADLNRLIHKETGSLPHLHDAFPAAWFSIKDRLAGMQEDYLTFQAFRRICEENGEMDPAAQDSLAGYLHSLGIALNYKDDPRLRDMHVLNPRWVTEGIYRILNSRKLADQHGEIRVNDLAIILDDSKAYPRDRHTFLLDLMRKFELAIRFAEEEDRYLIPELLDENPPEEARADEFDPPNCLNFEYDYPVLPHGLLPRFIVRTHFQSAGLPRWRSGVILTFEGNRALVVGDNLAKRVRIRINGATLAGRRRLLAIIRSDFETIHRTYKFHPRALVPAPDYPDVVIPYAKLRTLEEKGRTTLTEVIGSEVVDFDVRALLDGVDLEGARRPPVSGAPMAPLNAFVSYSQKDETLRAELETHLKLLNRGRLLNLWTDRCIGAGDEWKDEIDENLIRADLILLLVSADFIASDYCYDIEMTRALERHDTKSAMVIPIIVRPCRWQQTPFGKLQALPTKGRPVSRWGPGKLGRDAAWESVARGIEKALKRLREPKPTPPAGLIHPLS